MVIFGEEYGFMLTVGASAAIADLCPDGDLNRMNEVLDGKYSDTVNFTAYFIEAMAKGFDDAKRYAGEEVTHRPLTADMAKALPSDVFQDLQAAALASFSTDLKTTVEVAQSKKKIKFFFIFKFIFIFLNLNLFILIGG